MYGSFVDLEMKYSKFNVIFSEKHTYIDGKNGIILNPHKVVVKSSILLKNSGNNKKLHFIHIIWKNYKCFTTLKIYQNKVFMEF